MSSKQLDEIKRMFCERLNLENIDEASSLSGLGLDSLDVVDMCLDVEEKFGIQFGRRDDGAICCTPLPDLHADRTSDSYSDHSNSGGDAASGVESGTGEIKNDLMHLPDKTAWIVHPFLCHGLERILSAPYSG